MVCLQLRACEAKPSPYPPLIPQSPRTSEVAHKGANAPHAIKNSGKF